MPEFTLDHADALAVVTIDNPGVGNALSKDGARGLADAFDALSATTATRAVLIRSTGKSFCTGADLSGSASAERPVNGHMVRGMADSHHRMVSAIFHCRLPVVAAVQGAALGAGLHLALAADLVIAGESARFWEPFVDRGFNVDSGGSWLLPRLIGLPRSKQLLYLGHRLDANTALDWGLITDVVADTELDAHARSIAVSLAARPTQAVSATKRLLHDSLEVTIDQAMHNESMAVELTLRSNDFKEGMRAFVGKRPPEFTGT